MRLQRRLVFTLAVASVQALTAQTTAPVFGSVVPIGGSASDVALDESRGVLYIANFGAHVIDVMSTATNSINTSINVLPFPGAIALSFDDQYLLAAHFCSVTTPPGQTSPACQNAITSIYLPNNTQQVFSLASAPLGVAFVGNGQALVVTTTSFLLLNPATGQMQQLATIAEVAQPLPVKLATFPGQILQAALSTSADGSTVWGIASAGTSSQLVFQYFAANNGISATLYTSAPTLLPRVSSASDGSYAMIGYTLVGGGGYLRGRYPAVIQSANITGSVIDPVHQLIYAQIPDANQPTGPPGSSTASGSSSTGSGSSSGSSSSGSGSSGSSSSGSSSSGSGSSGSSGSGSSGSGSSGTSSTTTTPGLPAAMVIMDAYNLTFRDRISIPEDMVGRAVLNAAATMMYAISESGVMVLPVGSLNTSHRLAAAQEDVLVATNFCNRSVLSQSLTITDPGGGQTDFVLSTTQAGVTIVPATGVTPATVQVLVDPTVVPGSGGTASFSIALSSKSAVNQPKPVRLLVNNPDPSQKGTIVDQPGVLSDILADPVRNRVYVLRQDMNQLLVFDGGTLSPIATLRTATSPTMMAMTTDGNTLLVGHDDSELVTVYDLNALKPLTPILLPGGHFARSIAVSNAGILVLARNEGLSPPGVVDSVNLAAGTANLLPSLGAFVNSVSPNAVLASSPSGANVLLASPDGNVALYTAAANTFVTSRQDFTALSGAFAASDFGYYVVGNSVLDSSLVPMGVVSPSALPSSSFTFMGRGGYMASAASAAAAGSLLQVNSLQTKTTVPLTVAEAPLLPVTSNLAVTAGYGAYGSGAVSTHAQTSFSRTVAPLPSTGTIAMLTTSGITLLASSYPPGVSPTISGITNAANGSSAVAPGGLISIYGQNLSQASIASTGTPLSTSAGNSCLGVDGTPIPLLYTSSQQINGQLPFNVVGNATLTIHTPNGISNNYLFTVESTAPSVFMSAVAGTETGLATIFRDDNGQLVTPTNPIYPKDTLTIYLTGMGLTTPSVGTGQAAPTKPLAYASVQPTLTLGGTALRVTYAGLVPGEVGLYQINATVPASVAAGLQIPLVINQGGSTTTLSVRVVQ